MALHPKCQSKEMLGLDEEAWRSSPLDYACMHAMYIHTHTHAFHRPALCGQQEEGERKRRLQWGGEPGKTAKKKGRKALGSGLLFRGLESRERKPPLLS